MKNKPNEREGRQPAEKMDFKVRKESEDRSRLQIAGRPEDCGRTAIRQARLVLLIMINLAQLWVLSAAVEAALARDFKQLLPLVIASGVCWLIALSIFLWWKPAPRRRPGSGYLIEK